jgi:hypothetical protein
VNLIKKCGQVSFEFIIFIGLSFVMLLFFISITTKKISEITTINEKMMLEDIGQYIKLELYIAYNAHDGYQRRFEIPFELDGKPFDFFVSKDYFLYLNTSNNFMIMKIPYNGTIYKGINLISKSSDLEGVKIYVKQA